MKGLIAALWAESVKVLKSKMLWITIIFFIFVSSMMGLMMFVQKYPEIASKLGMIGTKASMMRLGKADWQSYLALITQIIAGIGMMGYGFITSWVFGREYSDHTIKDLLALPISRSYIVIAKLIIIVIWCILISFIFLIFTYLTGNIVQLSGWSNALFIDFTVKFTLTALLTLTLCTPVAFFASYSRGYLLPIGLLLLALIIANFTGLVGIGPYFPWAIPGIYSAPPGTEGMLLGTSSYIILFSTSIIGLIGTLAWWRYADQK